jgi:hypothetical protein
MRKGKRRSTPFEELHGAFVFLGCGAGLESAEIAPAAGFGIRLAGIEAVTAGLKFAYHTIPLNTST